MHTHGNAPPHRHQPPMSRSPTSTSPPPSPPQLPPSQLPPLNSSSFAYISSLLFQNGWCRRNRNEKEIITGKIIQKQNKNLFSPRMEHTVQQKSPTQPTTSSTHAAGRLKRAQNANGTQQQAREKKKRTNLDKQIQR